MIHMGVAQRLKTNLELELIIHDQFIWLENDVEDLVIIENDKNRWSCATSGCAAGYVWIEEAPVGSVFDTISCRVYDSVKNAMNETDGILISNWSAEMLGLNEAQEKFLFVQFGGTEETIRKIQFLMDHPDPAELDLY